ncbi:hypothetical protein V1478_008423 [Vespula squamosa]|uniref:DUF4817 domain-containing protein n=1 Tax=Vespula squamosa TaxID=30214 RepID=A0ABD2AVF9_VESSQ
MNPSAMAACYLSYPGVHTSSTQKIHGVNYLLFFGCTELKTKKFIMDKYTTSYQDERIVEIYFRSNCSIISTRGQFRRDFNSTNAPSAPCIHPLIARFRESGVTLNEFKRNITEEINNLSPKVLSEVMTSTVKEHKYSYICGTKDNKGMILSKRKFHCALRIVLSLFSKEFIRLDR